MKKTVFAAIAAIVMVSVSNIFATNNKVSFQPNVPVDTTATDTTSIETATTDTTTTIATSDSTATNAE